MEQQLISMIPYLKAGATIYLVYCSVAFAGFLVVAVIAFRWIIAAHNDRKAFFDDFDDRMRRRREWGRK